MSGDVRRSLGPNYIANPLKFQNKGLISKIRQTPHFSLHFGLSLIYQRQMPRIEFLAPPRETRATFQLEGEQFDRTSAGILANIIRRTYTAGDRRTPDIVVALPAGDSPIGMYREFVELFRWDPSLDLQRVTIVSHSELRLPRSDPKSNFSYFQRHLIGPINQFDRARGINEEKLIMFDGAADPPEAECERVIEAIANAAKNPEKKEATTEVTKDTEKRGIEVAFLGLGRNGHIAFNEPGSTPQDSARLVNLDPVTARRVGLNESGEHPHQAFTLGIKDIMAASRIILLVRGEGKENAYRQLQFPSDPMEYPVAYLKDFPRELIVVKESGIR